MGGTDPEIDQVTTRLPYVGFLGGSQYLNHPSCHALLPRVCYPVQQPVCWNRRIGWWNDFLISSHIPLNQCVCRIFPGSPGVRWTQTNLTKQILFCQAIPRWNEEFTVSIKKLKMVQCLSISFNDYISVYSWRLGSYQFLHGHNKHRWKTLGGPWWVSLSENMWPKNLMVHHGLSSYSLWIGGLANPGGLLFIRIFFQYMFSFDQTVQLPWPCAVSNPCHSLSGLHGGVFAHGHPNPLPGTCVYDSYRCCAEKYKCKVWFQHMLTYIFSWNCATWHVRLCCLLMPSWSWRLGSVRSKVWHTLAGVAGAVGVCSRRGRSCSVKAAPGFRELLTFWFLGFLGFLGFVKECCLHVFTYFLTCFSMCSDSQITQNPWVHPLWRRLGAPSRFGPEIFTERQRLNDIDYLRGRSKMWYMSGTKYDQTAKEFLPLLQMYDPSDFSPEALQVDESVERNLAKVVLFDQNLGRRCASQNSATKTRSGFLW